MTKYIAILVTILSFVAITYSQTPSKGLAIIEFQGKGNVHADAGAIVADLITNRINLVDFYVVERTQLPAVLKEQWYNMGDTVDADTAGKTKTFGVSYIMIGQISKLENRYYGGYRIINVDTVRKEQGGTVEGAVDFQDFVNKIQQLLMGSQPGKPTTPSGPKKIFNPNHGKNLSPFPTVPAELQGRYFYSFANGNFYAGILGELNRGPMRTLDSGGWSGEIEMVNGYYYFLKDGDFYAGTINGFNRQPIRQLDRGGWSGELDVANNGYYYYVKDGNLYGGQLNGFNRGPLILIDTGGWHGRIEFANGHLYFAKGQYLYAVEVQGVQKSPSNVLKIVGHCTWEGDFEIAGGYLYFVKQGKLYASKIRGLSMEEPRMMPTEFWNWGTVIIPK